MKKQSWIEREEKKHLKQFKRDAELWWVMTGRPGDDVEGIIKKLKKASEIAAISSIRF